MLAHTHAVTPTRVALASDIHGNLAALEAVVADRLSPRSTRMCRNIKLLFNFAPPVTEVEISSASLQFVRKISGFAKPSKANEPAFLRAVEEIALASGKLLRSLETTAPAKDRAIEAEKARARTLQRFPV